MGVHRPFGSFLIDLGSASGSQLDGERLPKEQPVKLKDGTVIRFGLCRTTYTFRIVDAQQAKGKRKR